jgi:hypothetical protein
MGRVSLGASKVNRLPIIRNPAYGRTMKLINYGDTDWLIGDDAADLLLEYSVLLAKTGSADSVDMAVLSADGEAQEVSMLIGPATMMTARPVPSDLDEPDNAEPIADVRGRIDAIVSPPPVLPGEPAAVIDDYEL